VKGTLLLLLSSARCNATGAGSSSDVVAVGLTPCEVEPVYAAIVSIRSLDKVAVQRGPVKVTF